jgi:hypothetical protein
MQLKYLDGKHQDVLIETQFVLLSVMDNLNT